MRRVRFPGLPWCRYPRDAACMLQLATGIPASAQAIIYRGAVLLDHLTVSEAGIVNKALLHLVRRAVNLYDVYRKEDLRINCRFCHVPGAPVVPRAMCGKCG